MDERRLEKLRLFASRYGSRPTSPKDFFTGIKTMNEPTVADELAFDALPEDVKALARRVLGSVEDEGGYDKGYQEGYSDGRDETADACYDEGYEEGYEEGKAEGYKKGYRDAGGTIEE